jgi:hypothetical protein
MPWTCNQAKWRSRFTKLILKRSQQNRGSQFFCPTGLPEEDSIGAGQYHVAPSRRTSRIVQNSTAHHAKRPGLRLLCNSGRLKMAPVPDLDLRRTHLLITKTLLTLYDLDVASDSSTDESIQAQGHASLGEDKRIDVKANFDSVRIRHWLPAEWKAFRRQRFR